MSGRIEHFTIQFKIKLLLFKCSITIRQDGAEEVTEYIANHPVLHEYHSKLIFTTVKTDDFLRFNEIFLVYTYWEDPEGSQAEARAGFNNRLV